MHRTQIQLTDEQLQILRARAAELGVSIASVIRDLAEREGEATTGARKRAAAAIGGFHSGRGDVSREHDRYLDEAIEP